MSRWVPIRLEQAAGPQLFRQSNNLCCRLRALRQRRWIGNLQMQRGDLGMNHIAAAQRLGDCRQSSRLRTQIHWQTITLAEIAIEIVHRPRLEFFQACATLTRLDKRQRADEYTLFIARELLVRADHSNQTIFQFATMNPPAECVVL